MAVKDTLRIFDQAVVDFVKRALNPTIHGICDENGLPVDLTSRVIFASPERPYAAINSPQAQQDFDDADAMAFAREQDQNSLITEDDVLRAIVTGETRVDTERMLQTLQTPVIGVTRSSMVYAMKRNNSNPIRMVRPWDAEGNFYVQSQYPRPWDIQYQIDFHGRFRADLNRIMRWYFLWIRPTFSLKIDFGYPWGVKFQDMMFGTIQDTSLLETEENERWIRYTLPFTLEALLFESFEGPEDIPAAALNTYSGTNRIRTAKCVRIDVEEMCTGVELLPSTKCCLVTKENSCDPNPVIPSSEPKKDPDCP